MFTPSFTEGTVMSSYPYPPDPGTGTGTGISDDELSVTNPGTTYGTSGSVATGPTTSSTSSTPSRSTTDVAKEQAAGVGGTAAQAGQQVAGVAKEQAGEVMSEARDQARTLLDQTRTEVGSQAATQQQRAAESLQSLAGELRSMAGSQQEPGIATDLAQQAADKAGQLASWLADHEPGDLLAEVRTFARRRPGTFLALAAGAGVVAGRLTRGMAAGSPSDQGGPQSSAWGPGRHKADTDTETMGSRPFTRASGGTGYPASDPLGRRSSLPDADLTPPTTSPGLGTTGTGAGETATGLGNDVTR
jgi:hypothetical protein